MKLRNLFKNTTKVVLTFLIVLGFVSEVNAADQSLTIYKEDWGSAPYSTLETFHIKRVSGTNQYVYCAEYAKNTPNYVKYNLGKEITDPGMAYILAKGANNADNTSYFITQSALWIYMYDKGIMTTCNNASNCPSVANLRKEVYASSGPTAKAIQNLVAEAKSKTTVDNTITLSANTSTLTFTLSSDGKYYVSNNVSVNSNGSYTVSITNAPSGTVKEDVSGGFRVKVPADKVTELSTNVKVTINASKKAYRSYIYNPVESRYQTVAVITSENLTKSLALAGTISKTSVTISKVDATNGEELPGAHLKLVCDNGKYTKEWTSGTTPKVLTDVPDGECELSETIAPEGYIKTTNTIKFTVKDGKVDKPVIMENQPEKKTYEVEISKVDVATSEELPGAKLEVTNEKGIVVCKWTSDGTTHKCKNLIAGTYTLTEISAPDGYEVAESITFTLDENGKLVQDGKEVDKIVMKDAQTPTTIIDVPDTLSLKSSLSYLLGLIIVLAGSGLVFKSVKKNEQ